MTLPTLASCRHPELGVLRVGGTDARSFLHAQTTQDIAGLAEDRITLAAWLSPKGRVRAVFDVVPAGGAFLLVTSRDVVENLHTGLQRFVLRSAVTLESTDLVVTAIVGDAASSGEAAGIGIAALEERETRHSGAVVFAGVGAGLVYAIGEEAAIAAKLSDIPGCEPVDIERAEIRLGRPIVPAALDERYVPQMLNLDRLGGVSFTKGCYPGQEIVARAQNLGEVKRRLQRLQTTEGNQPETGDEIHADGRVVGQVNRAARAAQGYELLAVLERDAAGSSLTLADDRKLTPLG